MNHTALIVTAGSGPGGRAVAPFLLPAVRAAASACCEDVREIPEAALGEALGGLSDVVTLLLDAAMPFITGADCRLLLEKAEQSGKTTIAKGAADGLPRCEMPGSKEAQKVRLSDGALVSVKEPGELPEALKTLRHRKAEALMAAGVVLLDPRRTYIDADVRVGAGTVIYPGCTLTGCTAVGVRCTLLPGCRVHASSIGDDTTVENSVLTECSVGNKTTVGPFAYLRPGARVGNGCRVGDFVELKNSTVGDGAHISHLTYVGDSDVGQRVNLGCGVVFVNFDGKAKHRSTVGDDAFIGCNVNLISPVRIGPGAYVAAGSTITDEVPAGAFAIARERQTNKEGWVERRKTEGKL
ncbi:MAG: hypothetical protein FWF69_04730 [Firmicutes bacterium]|nr:hypothetical protein [Bacillota bacterium]